jgi:hypothetical protein
VVYIHSVNPRGLIATCAAAVVLLTGCTPKNTVSDADAAAASEAAKARSGLPTTADTPGRDSTAPTSAPPLPTALTRNPIYRVGKLPSAKCAEPAYEPTSLTNARAYFTQYVACLNKAWAPVIRKAGFTFRPPKLVVVLGQSPSSPCTVDDGRDYYCGGTIYMDAKTHLALYREDPDEALAWMVSTSVPTATTFRCPRSGSMSGVWSSGTRSTTRTITGTVRTTGTGRRPGSTPRVRRRVTPMRSHHRLSADA